MLISKEILVCPLDRGELILEENGVLCSKCHTQFPYSEIGRTRQLDFRAKEVSQSVPFSFNLPLEPISPRDTLRFGRDIDPHYKSLSRQKLRRLYQSKLQREILYYCSSLVAQIGPELNVLDLGCGKGGNTEYLKSLGATNIIKVDYYSELADYQVDVHRMPFCDEAFDLVITTSTIEHFYNPFIAFQEISRVLKPSGTLIASGSFWESWHGNSCFHFTPGGLMILCESAGLDVVDMWSGWGFIPSIFSHATGIQSLKPVMYFFQKLFDGFLRKIRGEDFSRVHKFRTSGSIGILAKKINIKQ